ncbi:hypothetical protein CH063_10463, partial [Colletotrichum higginsianum]
MQVYHYLHCVNALRRGVYQDVYGTPSTAHLVHLDHCVDMLRLAVQCQSDMTPMLYFHRDNDVETMLIKSHDHTCRNFKTLHEWAVARSTCKDNITCAIDVGREVGG